VHAVRVLHRHPIRVCCFVCCFARVVTRVCVCRAFGSRTSPHVVRAPFKHVTHTFFSRRALFARRHCSFTRLVRVLSRTLFPRVALVVVVSHVLVE
jgi:hypothetical protein